MRWTLRCRGPAGPVTIGVEDTCTVHELQQIIADKTEITVERQELLAGFPPKALQLTGAQTSSISGVGIANGDSLVVREREDVPEAVQEPEPAQSLANGNTAETDHDADLARALAASLADSVPAAHTFAGVSTSRQPIAAPAAAALGAGPAPTSFRLADGSSVVRRIIDSDNSCLFNAVGYVMERSRRKAQELRQVIARVVAADPGGCRKMR